jgi:hypothetical protein
MQSAVPLLAPRQHAHNLRRRPSPGPARSRDATLCIYGFSWTTDITVARKFAEHWASPELSSSGVLLQTEVPPAAVLLTREPEDYYDEGEVVVDPYRLGR